MNVAIVGYGKMGREIEKILISRGHTVALIIDQDNVADLNAENLKNIDVAIEFTTPRTAYTNLKTCIEAGTPVVSGTTGWLDKYEELKSLCVERESALFYASNYSLGVNLMFRINKQLAALMNKFDGYSVEVEEIHHIHKLDAPSGTAITIAEGLIEELDGIEGWVNDNVPSEKEVEIRSIREGEVPGTHTVTYESADDILELKHTIKNRSTLAYGAVIASEFLCGKVGVYSMEDMLK
ncbi:MAG: 4-hydroxy-tetrahydrodipicolinate reductase [Rikenellaceae bacterium]